MTVYDGEAYLGETVESILSQTYGNFRFLILDNGSTDRSREIIASYKDPRIDLVALPVNIGQVAALNKGLAMIDTPYIARMDADDISLPRRLERQVAFMDANPGVGVCGTFAATFGMGRETKWRWPTAHEDIKVKLLFECCLAHPSVMLRKSFFDKHELTYDEKIGHSFDWELWQRAADHFELANIPEFLTRYRLHPANESKKTLHLQETAARQLDDRSLGRLGLAGHPQRQVHRDIAYETFNAANREADFLDRVVRWFEELEAANKKYGVYSQRAMERFLNERLAIILHYNITHRRKAWKLAFKKRLYRGPVFFKFFKLSVKVALSFLGLIKTKHKEIDK
jgi:glycosyltransferase involved in cell wall biosynthesis